MASLHPDDKGIETTASTVLDESISVIPDKYHGTAADRHEMSMLGKKQVLRVGPIIPHALDYALTSLPSAISRSSRCSALPQRVSAPGKGF